MNPSANLERQAAQPAPGPDRLDLQRQLRHTQPSTSPHEQVEAMDDGPPHRRASTPDGLQQLGNADAALTSGRRICSWRPFIGSPPMICCRCWRCGDQVQPGLQAASVEGPGPAPDHYTSWRLRRGNHRRPAAQEISKNRPRCQTQHPSRVWPRLKPSATKPESAAAYWWWTLVQSAATPQ